MERRQFIRLAAVAGAAASVPAVALSRSASASASTATLLDGAGYAAKFTAALPRPPRIDLSLPNARTRIHVSQFTQQVLAGYPATRLYGYGPLGGRATWPGPTITARANRPVHVEYLNRLPGGSLSLADGGHLLPVDPALLDDALTALPPGQKPIVPHLHGGHTEWESDGYPEAWFTQRGIKGQYWRKQTYTFDNSQVGGTLWYHDHVLGITRLNVYAGLAGMYLLRDADEELLMAANVLPSGPYEHELIIQDRQFTSDGQLFFPTAPGTTNGAALDQFGDFIMVNGTPWPVLDVEPRKYRFRLLNGSDSRTYVLQLSTDDGILVIGDELSLLPSAAEVGRLVIAPGERYDIVLDFTSLTAGTEVTLLNNGIDGPLTGFGLGSGPGATITNQPSDPALGFGPAADPASSGQVMRFRVSRPLSRTRNASVSAGTHLGPPPPARTATRTRGVMTMFGQDGQHNGMEMLGSIDHGTALWMDPVTEVVPAGSTEIWEIYNTGPVVHPIHLHLVDFQLLSRGSFTGTTTPIALSDGGQGGKLTVTGTGAARGPESYETGRKDTVICYPNEVTRVIATFDRAGHYVWHCHLLTHEDMMMMRPLRVT